MYRAKTLYRGLLTRTDDKNYTFSELLEKFGMNFTAIKADLHYDFPNQMLSEGFEVRNVPRHTAIIREDTGALLGVTGKDFGLSQYSESFAMVEELCQEDGTFKCVAGATVDQGAKGYMILEGEGAIELSETDKILNRFVVCTAFDGTSKLKVYMAPTRSSNNTTLILDDYFKPISFKHSKHMNSRLAEARFTIKKIKALWHEFDAVAHKMIHHPITDANAKLFMTAIVSPGDDDKSTRTLNVVNDIFDIYKRGVVNNVPSVRNNILGCVLAIVEWADMYKTVRSPKYIDENSARINAALAGDAAKKKAEAWAMAYKMADIAKEMKGTK